jgi:hypothetical protein
MLTLLNSPYCPKAYHRLYNSLRIVEYHRIIIIVIPKSNIIEPRTQDSVRVCDLSSCNLLVETNNFGLPPRSSIVLSF